MNKKITLYFTCLFFTIATLAQTSKNHDVYEAYDAIVSQENTGLYNGTEFKDIYNNTDKTHRYYNLFDFSRGTVVYDGQLYSNVLLKYDLFEDQLITKSDDNMSVFSVQLISGKVSNFTLYTHDFVRLSNIDLNGNKNGFYEVGFKSEKVELYIKNVKTKKEKAVSSGVQYRFKSDNFYMVYYNGHYKVVNAYRDFKDLMPDQYQQVKDFYKSYRALYKSNRNSFMIKLVTYLDGSLL
ncbi:hypothetical protein [Ulvibacter antarcticus]|uniref:hypothetical protein n=1 Tax=Ulvibacter antarcticus TaxID=442714 RepID=UPI0011C426DE|nr:hypothetical protein [Ulvibacter antarcticus]